MSDIVLEFDGVWKKFKRGERFDSLRDLIPAITKRVFHGKNHEDLREREFWALREISFQVERGEALGIVGPNGAGKSTILKLLSGIMRPNKGNIRISGRLSALIEVGAGFHPDLTGRENVYLNGTILGMSKSDIDKRFDEIVDFSGIKEFIDTPVKRYSSGMYARLGFSVAAHVDPDVLLVDEVLSVGDWAFQRKCIEKMESFVSNGATIIFVSHNLQAVSSLCPKSLLLEQGSVIAYGQTKNVVRKYLEDSRNSKSKLNLNEPIFIRGVKVLGTDDKPAIHFKAGEKAKIEIEIVSRSNENNMSVGIDLMDKTHYPVFNTSSERLGHRPISLLKGKSLKLTFDLWLHLTQGTYYLAAYVKQYDFEKYMDRILGGTITVDSNIGVRGPANLYPIFRVND